MAQAVICARAIIERRLEPGETLLWYASPDPWRLVRRRWPVFLSGLFFVIVAFQTVNGVHPASSNATRISLTIGAAGVGLSLWGLRLMLNSWRTAYGLTDRRAIIAVGDRGSTQYFAGESFYNIKVRSEPCSGSLEFDYTSDNEGGWFYRNGFYGIRDPARVEALIRKYLLEDAPPAPTGDTL